MTRLLASVLRLGFYGLAVLYYCVTEYPWWTLAFFLFLLVFGWWDWQKEQKRVRMADVQAMTPLQYEQHCAALLSDAGWQAKTTPRNDQGVDVVAEIRGVRAVIQCKKYKNRVGNAAVQEIAAGRRHYGAHIAAVVCPMGYTKSSVELARSNGVLLLHHSELAGLDRLARIP